MREKIKVAVVTLNPGIDRIIYLPAPARLGTLNRAARSVVSQGSKGANVAIMLKRLGIDAAYFTFGGGDMDALCRSFTERENVDARITPTGCGVRMNIKIIDSEGGCTEFNERGGPVSREELDGLVEDVVRYRPAVAIIDGSLPEGAPVDTYARLCRELSEIGCYCVLDADGAPLKCALEGQKTHKIMQQNGSDSGEMVCAQLSASEFLADFSPDTNRDARSAAEKSINDSRPRLIKPNARELAGLVGCEESELDRGEKLRDAMLAVRGRYGCDVICTLDSRGAVGLGREGMWRVTAAPVELHGFSGAGDTFLAAYIYARLCGGGANGTPGADGIPGAEGETETSGTPGTPVATGTPGTTEAEGADGTPAVNVKNSPMSEALVFASAAAGAKVEQYGTALPEVGRIYELMPTIKSEKIFIKNT